VHDIAHCFDTGDHNVYINETFFFNEHTKLTKMHDDLEKYNNTRALGLQLFKLLVFNLLAPELFFSILAHSVYKMRIKQEPNTLEL